VRVLDDRSLNGVFVNGERIEGRLLRDGDEIIVGRYRLSYLVAS
jgi:pSer/pThr/pTyr-binding forkhead associated (FHA) protein